MIRPIAIHLIENANIEQVERIADDTEHQRTDKGVAKMPAPTKKACAADNDGCDRVELEQVAVERELAAVRPDRTTPPMPRTVRRSHR